MSWAADGAIKVALLIAAAMLAARCLAHSSAAVRHWVLAAALSAAIVLPVITPLLPAWRLDLAPGRLTARAPESSAVVSGAAASSRAATVAGPVIEPGAVAASITSIANIAKGAGRWLALAWIAGSGLMFVWLALELGRLRWYSTRSGPFEDDRLLTLAAGASAEAGLQRPVSLRESPSPGLLATWGILRPRLMLPAGARGWSDERARIVFLHEMAHIRRLDWGAQLLSDGLRCVYWFNPLTWIAASRLRLESEQACDDAVLSAGVDGADYAAHLLELARMRRAGGRVGLAATAMARPSSLERRVTAMLDFRNRVSPDRASRAAILAAIVVLAVAIGAADIIAQNFSTFSGSVIDPSNRVLPQATLVLTNLQTGAKHEVKSDATGRFEFVGLPPASYTLDVVFPGFSSFHGNLTVAGERVHRDLSLEVGSLQETLTVVAHPSSPAPAPSAPRPAPVRRTNDGCVPSATGGVLRPPHKLVDVKPRYPDSMEAGRGEGVVVMKATIDKDGNVSDTQITSAAQPDFDAAAIDAVRQWQFDSTLLNCEPVDVHMTVTISFKYQR